MIHRAVFLDRDGTINYDSGYVKDPAEIVILPGVAEGIRKLKYEFGFKMVVVSNQAGVAKGIMMREDVEAVNSRINQLLMKEGTAIDAFYYCPFHPDFDLPEKTDCRKPSPKMILTAAEELHINLGCSYMIGDKASDIECGINAGVKTIMLQSSNFDKEISALHNQRKKTNFVAANFIEACDFIIKDFLEDNN